MISIEDGMLSDKTIIMIASTPTTNEYAVRFAHPNNLRFASHTRRTLSETPKPFKIIVKVFLIN